MKQVQHDRVGKKPLILGVGSTGLSFIGFLKHLGYEAITIWDRNLSTAAREACVAIDPAVEMISQPLTDCVLKDYTSLCISPGMPRAPIAKLKGCPPIVSEFDLFADYCRTPVVAVTGSNGKSTVCDLLTLMGREDGKRIVLAGNIGVPILDSLLKVWQNKAYVDYYVVELSSFQLESIQSLAPYAATVLNVTPDHLDRYDSFADYKRVKYTIYDRAKYGVYNLDQRGDWPKPLKQDHLAFSSKLGGQSADFYYDAQSNAICFRRHQLCTMFLWEKQGVHFAENVMAALALGLLMDLDMTVMVDTAAQYKGLKHRCQKVAVHHDITWINDSKGTNVDASLAAIRGLAPEGKRLIWIAGGRGKDSDYRLLEAVVTAHVKKVILLGEDAPVIAAVLSPETPVHHVKSLEEAVMVAASIAEPGDVVLLSPACASFDMFKNFEVRGDCFIKAVNDLLQQAKEGL